MKKISLLLLSILLIFAFASCEAECEHVYDNDCDATCNECDEAREAMAHDYLAADCDTPKTCKNCTATDGDALGHELVTPDVNLCEVMSTCSRCGMTEGQNKEHSYDNACDVVCNGCNKTRFVQHDYSVIQNDENYHWSACSVCERQDGENKEKHVYDNACDTTCNTCEKSRTTAHIPNADDGDCTTSLTCIECSTVLIAAKSHDFGGDFKKDASGHWHVCTNEGCTKTDTKVNHTSSGAATDTSPEKCAVCEYVITPELDHIHEYNVPSKDTANHWLECACGDKKDVTPHSATNDNDCTTVDICSCGYTVRAAKDHTPARDDGNCKTEIKCTECGKTAVAGATDHNDTNHDFVCDNHGCQITVDGAPKDENEGIDLPLVPNQ